MYICEFPMVQVFSLDPFPLGNFGLSFWGTCNCTLLTGRVTYTLDCVNAYHSTAFSLRRPAKAKSTPQNTIFISSHKQQAMNYGDYTRITICTWQ